jgi:glycolate oxidase FAD binding subunit
MTSPEVTLPAPATPGDVREAVRAALTEGSPLRVVGRGTWLDAGRPVRASAELSLARVSGVVAYVPGDLTMTVLAGTTLGEIADITRAERQFLAMDPVGGDAGSVGATVATASAGALAQAFGLPRDNVLGVEFVTGRGALVRGGGRVVKNVAGFDLTRLVTGAWGTLGVLTEVTVRLRALPEADVTVAVEAPAGPLLAPWLARLAALPLAPYALELVSAGAARSLGIAAAGGGPVLLARLGGNEPLVAAQGAALRSLGDAAEAGAPVWSRLRASEPAGATVVRFSALPGDLAATWAAAEAVTRDAAPDAGTVRASVGRGVVRCVLPAAAPEVVAHAFGASTFTGTRIFERLPASLWPVLAPGPTATLLAWRTRDAFDPDRILNRGILGELVDG